ncbi:MAG: hypothetical protein FWF96_04875 [Kiritimatiellaeota bacterium]|nr:hypothetical protein [Kiritimatiellota bacterium]
MKLCLPLFLAFAFCLTPLAAQDTAADAVAVPEIRKTLDILLEEIKRLADAQAAMEKQLQANYKAQLAVLRRTMQDTGDLDNVLAVDAEVKRFDAALASGGDAFEEIPEMPRAAFVQAPAQLRAAQDGFTRQRQASLTAHKDAVSALSQRFVTRLDVFQRDFTRGGKIETALAVRALATQFKAAAGAQAFEALARSLTAAPDPRENPGAGDGANPAAGRAPWRQWTFASSGSYAPEGLLTDAPGLPNDMTLEFTPALGRGRVAGRAQTAPKTINGRRHTEFGKALQWEIGAPQNLNATVTLTSRHLAQAPATTPAAHVCVLADGVALADITVPLTASPLAIRLTTPQDGARTAVYCEQARPQTTTINLPADKELTLLLGFYMGKPGESCDTSFVIE